MTELSLLIQAILLNQTKKKRTSTANCVQRYWSMLEIPQICDTTLSWAIEQSSHFYRNLIKKREAERSKIVVQVNNNLWQTCFSNLCQYQHHLLDGMHLLNQFAKNMQPIDTINDKGFRKMIKQFEPRYTPPARKTVATKYIPKCMKLRKVVLRISWGLLSITH